MTRLDALLRRVADEQDTLRADARLRERLVVRVGRAAPPRRGLRHAGRWSLAAAIAMAGGALAFALGRPSTLEVEVGESGHRPAPGAWLDAPERKSLSLEFSDGSRFDLAPTSKARLVELQRTGARVELASGKMKVHVVPRRGTDFRLDAGPFGVHVTGTRFELSYRPESDTFELFLEEGQVELSGCVFGQGRKLAAGQSVRASCTKRSLDVSYGRPRRDENERVVSRARAAEAPLGAAARSEENARAGAEPRPAASASSGNAPDSSWLALARAGEYREAFSIVHAQGFEAECERASSAALGQLADVARHAGAPKQAEHALLTLRRRFPGTGDSALAAFALGRLEFDVYQAYPRAATWFKTYLSERPSGPMAREALGRLFEARYRAQDLVGARAGAARYLKEYPSGPHAELASRIVASP